MLARLDFRAARLLAAVVDARTAVAAHRRPVAEQVREYALIFSLSPTLRQSQSQSQSGSLDELPLKVHRLS
jgi:hypothetical protein